MGLAAPCRYEFTRVRWMTVILTSLAFHALFLFVFDLLIRIQIPAESVVATKEILILEVNMATDDSDVISEHTLPPVITLAPQDEPAPPASLPIEQRAQVLEETPLPTPPPSLPNPNPEVSQPEPEKPGPLPFPRGAFADSHPDSVSEPPPDAKYIAESNNQAADRAEKNKPIDEPTVAGESQAVAFSRRRGESEQQPAAAQDVRSGNVQIEGTPDPGQPPKPQDAPDLERLPEREAPKTAPRLAREETPASGALQSGPEPSAHEKKDALDSENKEALALALPKQLGHPHQSSPPRGKDEQAQEPLVAVGERRLAHALEFETRNPNEEPRSLQSRIAPGKKESPLPEPQTSDRTGPALDPELARLQKVLGQLSSRHPRDNALPQSGAGGVLGHQGVQGDGSLRHGESSGISDILTENHATVAARTGEVAFATKANPEAAYLKPYLARVNDHWKRLLIASRMRYESGYVTMRFTINREGTVTEAVEVRRHGDVNDNSVAQCKRALESAPTQGNFPPNLAGKGQVTWALTFMY